MIESFPSFEERLLYSSDYPHWDYDAPDEAFRKARLSPEVENKIMHANACSLYGIGIPAA
jgi:predicted TIM-barrel fold metal-dependent hydrolase